MPTLPLDNLKYPVLVKIGNSSGSGFYLRTENNLFLVTAYHVIHNKEGLYKNHTALLISYNKDDDSKIELTLNLDQTLVKKDSESDVTLIKIGDFQENSSNTGIVSYTDGVTQSSQRRHNIVVVPLNGTLNYSEINISNDVFIIGYPNSLGIPERNQIEKETPLLRKGILAGKNETNQTIILDCPVYFGNSGGVVIEVDTNGLTSSYKAIGIVTEYIPFVEKLRSLQHMYENINLENSGYSIAIPIDRIIELAEA